MIAMIHQQIDSPMPILLDFVVTNGSRMLSRSFGSILSTIFHGDKQISCVIDLVLFGERVAIRHTVHGLNGVRNQIYDNLLQLT